MAAPGFVFSSVNTTRSVRNRRGEAFLDQRRPPRRLGEKRRGPFGLRASVAANMERTLETLDCLGSRRCPRRGNYRSGQSRRHFWCRRHLPFPIYSKWAAAYKAQTGTGLNYQSIGSGGGIAQIEAKTVTFGASDMPMTPADLDKNGLLMFPTVVGSEVLVYNLPGIASNALVIDGPTLANIYMGRITKWNDPSIKKLNPTVNLPNTAIAVVHRSDGSGTTFIFANYLSKVSKEWADKVGAATAVDWPVGIGAKGNEGVSNNVGQTKGSIGYETAYAKQNPPDDFENGQQGWQDGRSNA